MKGTIEKIWQNKTKDKKDYWVLSIDGERYSVWEPDYMKDVKEGLSVEYEWTQSGEFKKITVMGVTGAKPKSSVKLGYKDQQIVRMACLKSASTLVSNTELTSGERAEVALDLARKFERYIVERDEDDLDHEREPGEEG